jgi:hypothetical protein
MYEMRDMLRVGCRGADTLRYVGVQAAKVEG